MLTLLSVFAWIIATATWMTLVVPMGNARAAGAASDRGGAGWNRETADPAPLVADRWRPIGSWGATGRTEL